MQYPLLYYTQLLSKCQELFFERITTTKIVLDIWSIFSYNICMNLEINDFLDTLKSGTTNAWEVSKFYPWQRQGNKEKGVTGENFVSHILESKGYTKGSGGGGSSSYDLVFNGIHIEVKCSFAMKKAGEIYYDMFKWQHIGINKNWDYIAFVGINPELELNCRIRRGWRDNPEEVNLLWFSKSDILQFVNAGYLTIQQGGQSSSNDDYWTTASFFKDIDYGKNYKKIPF